MSALMNDRLPRPRITVDEYYRMAEVGLLAPDSRTELIEGEVIEMVPMGSRHAGKVSLLSHLIFPAVGSSAQVRVQLPVRLDDCSEPMPDLAVALPRKDFYSSRHPWPADTLLIVEVSQSSLRHDRSVKVPLYARHQVPEVWLMDLERDEMHIFRSPGNGGYNDVSSAADPKRVTLAALPGVSVDLSGFFES